MPSGLGEQMIIVTVNDRKSAPISSQSPC
jgi:hypothetical protein